MGQQDVEPSGDYGYDLAHETVRGTSRRPAEGAGPSTRPSTSHAGGTSDRGEDLAYDEAHDF